MPRCEMLALSQNGYEADTRRPAKHDAPDEEACHAADAPAPRTPSKGVGAAGSPSALDDADASKQRRKSPPRARVGRRWWRGPFP